MHYPAVAIPDPTNTPHVTADFLAAGEFRCGPAYRTWRAQGTEDWLVIYTVAGAGRIVGRDGGAHRLAEGEAVLYEPGAHHDYSTDPDPGRWHLLWAHFQPRNTWLPWLRWPQFRPGTGLCRLPENESRKAVRGALSRMVRLSRRTHRMAEPLAVNALEEALLWMAEAVGGGEWLGLDPRVRAAIDLLTREVATPFRADAIARACGLSPSRLSHLFKRETGMSLQQAADQARVRQAKHLLAYTDLPIQDVAGACGFESAFYFSRRFRRATGNSPSAFRERMRGGRTGTGDGEDPAAHEPRLGD